MFDQERLDLKPYHGFYAFWAAVGFAATIASVIFSKMGI